MGKGSSGNRNRKDVRDMRAMETTGKRSDGKAPDGDLFLWASLDLFASAAVMFTAFASRSLRGASAAQVAQEEVK